MRQDALEMTLGAKREHEDKCTSICIVENEVFYAEKLLKFYEAKR